MLIILCMVITNLTAVIEAADLLPDVTAASESGENPSGDGLNTETSESAASPENGYDGAYPPDASAADMTSAPFSDIMPMSDDYVTGSVFVELYEGEGVEDVKTGEQQIVRVLAYNDNPNDTAIAAVRIYIEAVNAVKLSDGTISTKVFPLSREPVLIDTSFLSGNMPDPSVPPSKIEGSWHYADEFGNLLGDNPEAESVKYNCLEFRLPAGSSVSFDIPLIALPGYDKEVVAKAHYTWSNKNSSGVSPRELPLTWTGDINWNDFNKSVRLGESSSVSAIAATPGSGSEILLYYKDGVGFKPTDELIYNFSAVNATVGGFGYIYTKNITLKDDLTLPDGMTVPAGAKVEADAESVKLLTSDGRPIYELKIDPTLADDCVYLKDGKVDGTIETDSTGRKIHFEVTLTNSDVEANAVNWNPVGAVSAVLHLGELDGTPNSGDFSNDAELTARSVDSYDYETKLQDSAQVSISTDNSISHKKEVVDILNDKKQSVGKSSLLQNGYIVKYKITVRNDGELDYSKKIEITDILPSGLSYFEDIPATVKLTVNGNVDEAYADERWSFTPPADKKSLSFVFDSVEDVEAGESVSLPAHSVLEITYTAKLDLEELKNSTPEAERPADGSYTITNSAVMDGKTSETVVKTSPNGGIHLYKNLVRRVTHNIASNSNIVLSRNMINGTFEGSNSFSGGDSSIYHNQDDSAAELINEMNAGDVLEYVI